MPSSQGPSGPLSGKQGPSGPLSGKQGPSGGGEQMDDVPEAAGRRLAGSAFTSGLTVPDFAACLHMGMRPVGLVQGSCVTRWPPYPYGYTWPRGQYVQARRPPAAAKGAYSGGGAGYSERFACPHGFVSAEHRTYGWNDQKYWMEEGWGYGFGTAYGRMVEEAVRLGAHGIIGLVDSNHRLADTAVMEFHVLGTAVVVEGAGAPRTPWTTYLAGQRLAKLMDAGFLPVTVVAAMAAVRVYEVCVTQILLRGAWGFGGPGMAATEEITQLAAAHMGARRLARDQVRSRLGTDTLQGARLEVSEREVGEGEQEITCILRGTRVRRVRHVDPLPAPVPTVRLS